MCLIVFGVSMSHANQNRQIGWPQVVRDIVLKIVGRGQLLLLVAGLILLVIVARMPQEEIGHLALRLVEVFETEKLLGYLLSICILIAWGIHARLQRRWMHEELARMSNERNKVQSHALGNQVKPSGRK